MRMGEAGMPMAMEIVEQPLYDTQDLKRMGQHVQLFACALGMGVPSIWSGPRVKDYWETNLYQSGQVESPNEFWVRDISVLLYDKDGPLPVFDRTGMGNLWAKSYLRFKVNRKLYWEGPLSLVADPVCQLGGLEFLQKMSAGSGMKCALRLLNRAHENPLDVRIQSQVHFGVQVTPYTPVCRQISVRVVLNGKKIRPVL